MSVSEALPSQLTSGNVTSLPLRRISGPRPARPLKYVSNKRTTPVSALADFEKEKELVIYFDELTVGGRLPNAWTDGRLSCRTHYQSTTEF
jgi:hypothetical protein